MPNWTDAQLDAIKARRGTVLVSAAAGSGKTAVLVERVIERLTDPEHPTDADRLLVVTFTKAAAAEMRDRIEKRLLALMKEQPENTRLRRQQLLLQQAHICTVDSFCSDIVREFFYLLGISPDFSIITDKQQEELMTESLDEVLTEWYKLDSAGSVTVTTGNLAQISATLPTAKVGDKVTKSTTAVYSCPIVRLESGEANEDEVPALTIYRKRDVNVETERKPKIRTTEITADEFYVAVLSNEAKVVLARFKE